jgi:acyl-CoA thioesterase I
MIGDCMTRLLSLLFFIGFSMQANCTSLLILGDSLSAGYQMPIDKAWPTLLPQTLKAKNHELSVINGSISGDTTNNGLQRLPQLLQQYQPNFVLIELGANDGLQGFPPTSIATNLTQLINMVKANNAIPFLMQIRIPPNYGKRYGTAFSETFSKVATTNDVPLIPFFLEQVITKPEWMRTDGIHPNEHAQPFIAEFMADQLAPLIN